MGSSSENLLHIVMYPWYALSPLTSFLRLANNLAKRGHRISFLLPTKTQAKLAPHNHHPNLITFVPITVPHVEGLPKGAETLRDVPNREAWPLLEAAMDLSKDNIDSHLAWLKPDLVFFDFANWVPSLARKYGAKSVFYATSSLARFAYLSVPCGWSNSSDDHNNMNGNSSPLHNNGYDHDDIDEDDFCLRLTRAPAGFPCPEMSLGTEEARVMVSRIEQEGGKMSLVARFGKSLRKCDAIASKTCRELEGPFCDYLEKQLGKPVLLAGPLVPQPPASSDLDCHLRSWLDGFGPETVVYCAIGSQYTLPKHQFQELLLGLELTGRPFLAVLKPPAECQTIDQAIPEGFTQRAKGRGIVRSDWVQQPLILQHPNIGCFVTHCGAGSISEAMLSDCQLVLLPQAADQFINAKMLNMYLRVGVEVERTKDGYFFTKDTICKAIQMVMKEESEIGKEVRSNHAKWREVLLQKGLEDAYIDEFIQRLQDLLVG